MADHALQSHLKNNVSNRSTSAKALRVNLDERKYGTIAEIGAGQEVARQFFMAGAAAGTVAKTISLASFTTALRN